MPEAFREAIDAESMRKSAEYTIAKGRFGMVERTFSAVFLLLLILTGCFGRLELLLAAAGLPGRIHGIVYIFIVSFIFSLFSLPFSACAQFRIEERYGFNTMGPGLFFLDIFKGLLLSAVIFFPLLYGLFFLIDAADTFWWLFAFGGIALFQLLMTILYPLLIAPLFNKYTPLEDGPLRDRLNALAKRLDFRTSGIFVMDGSKRSTHSNAFFTGIGRVKRIVLFDTLLERLNDGEIEAVLAHEIGHERKKHTVKLYLVSVVFLVTGLYLAHLLLGWDPLYRAFGFTGASPYALVVLFSICAGPLTFLFKPLLTAWSRKFEYEADEFAVRGIGRDTEGEHPLVSGLIRLHTSNLSNLTPHPLYSFYHYSHPALRERVAAVEDSLSKAPPAGQ